MLFYIANQSRLDPCDRLANLAPDSGCNCYEPYIQRTHFPFICFNLTLFDEKAPGNDPLIYSITIRDTQIWVYCLICCRSLWVGLADGVLERQFRWTTTRVMTWGIWASGRPQTNYAVNCVSLYNGELTDSSCVDIRPYLCQSHNDGERALNVWLIYLFLLLVMWGSM